MKKVWGVWEQGNNVNCLYPWFFAEDKYLKKAYFSLFLTILPADINTQSKRGWICLKLSPSTFFNFSSGRKNVIEGTVCKNNGVKYEKTKQSGIASPMVKVIDFGYLRLNDMVFYLIVTLLKNIGNIRWSKNGWFKMTSKAGIT